MQRLDVLERRLVHPAARIATQANETRALAARLARAFRYRIEGATSDASTLGKRLLLLLREPPARAAGIARARDALVQAAAISRERTASRLDALAQRLALLNPAATLERGYAIVATTTGTIVTDAGDTKIGDEVTIRFARGGAGAKITKVEK